MTNETNTCPRDVEIREYSRCVEVMNNLYVSGLVFFYNQMLSPLFNSKCIGMSYRLR